MCLLGVESVAMWFDFEQNWIQSILFCDMMNFSGTVDDLQYLIKQLQFIIIIPWCQVACKLTKYFPFYAIFIGWYAVDFVSFSSQWFFLCFHFFAILFLNFFFDNPVSHVFISSVSFFQNTDAITSIN